LISAIDRSIINSLIPDNPPILVVAAAAAADAIIHHILIQNNSGYSNQQILHDKNYVSHGLRALITIPILSLCGQNIYPDRLAGTQTDRQTDRLAGIQTD